ncbi:unnamed protein product [Phytophthora fragariaefolia]|uniref:Unnamed protein product n=1 Tax=Phytophthora fragariaefolia TaxID=1490495 RepID=A0A9W6X827_9STRA|nr:unnamed protein product [Phytophthora fragariaefolia]
MSITEVRFVNKLHIVAATDAPGGNATEAPVEVEGHTTTIKTEDGDEITIKRSPTSKGNKVTTISRDDKGTLRIEDTTAEEQQAEAGSEAKEVAGTEEQGTFEDIPTGSPSAIHKQDSGTARRDQEEETATTAAEGPDAGEEAVVVSGGKKVTVVQVNRSLTKVSLSEVEQGATSVGRCGGEFFWQSQAKVVVDRSTHSGDKPFVLWVSPTVNNKPVCLATTPEGEGVGRSRQFLVFGVLYKYSRLSPRHGHRTSGLIKSLSADRPPHVPVRIRGLKERLTSRDI